MRDWIKYTDFYGVDAEFINENGSKKFKNLFGGLLSIASLCLIMAGFIYFGLKFFNREDASIVTSIIQTSDVSIKNMHQFPFFIRISLSGAKLIPNPEKVWRVNLSIFTMDPAIGTSYVRKFYLIERCNLEKHFHGPFKYLVQDIQDLNTYFCIDWNGDNFDLKGDYGGSSYNQFLSIRFRPCTEELGDGPCLNKNEMNSYLQDAFIDIRTIDISIDNKISNVAVPILYGDRIAVSNTLFKRIYFFMKSVNYITDGGYVFQSQESIEFNQVDYYRVDPDIKDFNNIQDPTTYKCFAYLNLLLNKSKYIYERVYMKIQTYLANIGGLIKIITSVGTILGYSISNRLLELELCNSVVIDSSLNSNFEDSNIKFSSLSNNVNQLIMHGKASDKKSDILSNTNKQTIMMIESNFDLNNIISTQKKQESQLVNSQLKSNPPFQIYSTEKYKKIELNTYELLAPLSLFCNKDKGKLFDEKLKACYSYINIFNFIRAQQEFNIIKECFFEVSQKQLISSLVNQTNGGDYAIFRNAIDSKKEKNKVDMILLNLTK